MKITVIICTFNRCRSLSRALDSVTASALPESIGWEVLVVDNNSCDQTRAVLEDFCSRHPGRFRYLFEHRQGLSHARNAGIREARGDIVAFTDDDVIVEPEWLKNLAAILYNQDLAGACGRVLPEQTFSPPRWLALEDRYALAPLAIFDLGPKSYELLEPPFGANMAFRKDVFAKYGVFRTDLGRRPGSLMGNEDTEFGSRLLTAGERLRYEPSAVVYHPVSTDRLQRKYFLTWWFDKARGDIREFGIPHDVNWYALGIPLFMFRRLAVWTLRWMVSGHPSRRFSCKLKVWSIVGTIIECRRQSRVAQRNETIGIRP